MMIMMMKMIMRSGVDMSLSCEGQILNTSDWLSPIYQMTLHMKMRMMIMMTIITVMFGVWL